MIEDDSSERAREQGKKNLEGLSVDTAESMKEYIARAKSLALTYSTTTLRKPSKRLAVES